MDSSHSRGVKSGVLQDTELGQVVLCLFMNDLARVVCGWHQIGGKTKNGLEELPNWVVWLQTGKCSKCKEMCNRSNKYTVCSNFTFLRSLSRSVISGSDSITV